MAVSKAASAASTKAPSIASTKAPSITSHNNEKAGLTFRKPGASNPNPIQHGSMGQAERAFSAASTFLSGVMAISASQFIGAPLKLVDAKFYDSYMAWTKESFAVLMTTITQWWSPTIVRVTGDDSMKGQLFQMEDGSLKCNFPHRLVLMANHQLYTDWLYLWWIAYTNKMHGRIYIILKESLKQLPIFGWSAQFYNFIFLSRKWETDQWRFKRALGHLKNPKDPMWLLIFPEGTNLSQVTREKSAAWSKKTGIPDMKNQLLPRSLGLKFCLQELKSSTNWLYDCTIAYEGVPRGQYGQDIYTLRSSFLEGRPPKSVNMYWRRFRIADIPVDNEDAFARWLLNRWREKDYILEYFYKYNNFPAEDPAQALSAKAAREQPKHAKAISTEVRAGGWDEFLSIFGPITSAAGALSSIDMTEPLNFDALLQQVAKQQQLNLMNIGKAPIAGASQEAVRRALQAAQRSKALPAPVIDYIMKQAPTTQAQMKEAILAAANKTGNSDLARKAAGAPAAPTSMPRHAQKNVKQAAEDTERVISASSLPGRGSGSGPAPIIKDAMPLANMQALVTRPLSTMAMQAAATGVGKTAAQLTKPKTPVVGPAAGGPKKTSATLNGSKKLQAPSRAQSVVAVPDARKAPSTTGATGSARRPSVASVPDVRLAKKSTTSQAPLGTQKYVNGVKK